MLHPKFWDILELINNKFGIVLNTNGTLINESIAKRLSEYKIANVHISLDLQMKRHTKNKEEI